jgi:hypothetical protein
MHRVVSMLFEYDAVQLLKMTLTLTLTTKRSK